MFKFTNIRRLFVILAILPNILNFSPTFTETTIKSRFNVIKNLQKNNLWTSPQPLRLHLGCGECHLNGYINIDFPSTEHTVQIKRAADIFADITTLSFPQQSIDEVRSHHVFEHFNRQVALALLCSWHYALKVGGLLVIETPDFEASTRVFLNPIYSYEQKQITLRHIFGSHEASWAMHYDGWYKEKFTKILETLGFKILTIQYSGSTFIPNITVKAQKATHHDYPFLLEKAKPLLRLNMVNSGDEKMWRVWCNELEQQIQKTRYAD